MDLSSRTSGTCNSNGGDGNGCCNNNTTDRRSNCNFWTTLSSSSSSSSPPPSQLVTGAVLGKEEPVAEISDALKQLSVEQRQKAYEDVHGIGEEADATTTAYFGVTHNDATERDNEDPNMIQQKVTELEQHLAEALSSSSSSCSALRFAINQNKSYVENKNFRLSFLRADDFDSKLASIRLINFFQIKREIFPDDKLTKSITLQDFISETDGDDLDCLLSGGVQLLPLPDQAGRQIIVGMPALTRFRTPRSFVSFP